MMQVYFNDFRPHLNFKSETVTLSQFSKHFLSRRNDNLSTLISN